MNDQIDRDPLIDYQTWRKAQEVNKEAHSYCQPAFFFWSKHIITFLASLHLSQSQYGPVLAVFNPISFFFIENSYNCIGIFTDDTIHVLSSFVFSDVLKYCQIFLVLDGLNSELLKLFKVILHGLELFRGVSLPFRDLTGDAKRILRTV